MPKSTEEQQEEEEVVQELEQEQVQESNVPDENDKKIAELNDKLLRTLAEFDNFKKRTTKEKEAISEICTARVAGEILGVLDNFERAIAAPSTDEDFKKGMTMIFSQLKESLDKLGVEEIQAHGQPFDPNLHNAIMQIEDETFEPNTICEVFAKGYKIGDRIIRHAMVKVAK